MAVEKKRWRITSKSRVYAVSGWSEWGTINCDFKTLEEAMVVARNMRKINRETLLEIRENGKPNLYYCEYADIVIERWNEREWEVRERVKRY